MFGSGFLFVLNLHVTLEEVRGGTGLDQQLRRLGTRGGSHVGT